MQGKRTNVTRVLLVKIFKYGLSPFIFALALAAGLIILNYILAVKTISFDVTKAKVNTLSMESTSLLDDINFNVDIKAFYTLGTERRIKSLLEKFVKRNDGLKVEFIDPIKNPIIASEYEVSYPQTIVFETAGKQTRINPLPGRQQHQERDITIALYRLMTDQTKTIYFSVGHGEFSTDNLKQDGLSVIKEDFIQQNYMVDTVNLLEEGIVPEDCTLLIIAGLTVPFTDEETQMVRDFLDNKGSVLFMVPPVVEHTFDNILRRYGLVFGSNYIYETSSKFTTEVYGPISPLCTADEKHEITDILPNQNFIFPFVRSVDVGRSPGDVTITKLLISSENSWAETDLTSAKTVNTNQKPSRDETETKGPITVAVVTDREFELPDSLMQRDITTFKVRSGFFGNAALITNSFITSFPSNLNLFLNTVNWITRNEKIIEITPRVHAFTPVELRQSQRRLLTWLTLIIFPASILLVGVIILYRRR